MSKGLSDEARYKKLLVELKLAVRSTQTKAALAVNSSLIQLYWNMGKMIFDNQALFEGRNNYVNQLVEDLKTEFTDTTGFSRSNLFSIRKFYQFYAAYPVQQLVGLDKPIESSPIQQSASQNNPTENMYSVQQPVGLFAILFQVPWGHYVLILNKIKNVPEALFYLQQIVEHNWSRAILTLQIEQTVFQRQGKGVSNFKEALPEQQAIMAQRILKDPYNFGFLTLESKVQELEIEKQLTTHITKFLLELGKGFAFIGRQYGLQVGEKDYRLDLLFYHIRLRCFVVIDLKGVEFEPEFAGKMNFYLSIVDDQLKTDADQPSIGIILCKNKNKLEVEYALRGMTKPIGVSEFTVTQALSDELKTNLPTVEEFENELKNDIE